MNHRVLIRSMAILAVLAVFVAFVLPHHHPHHGTDSESCSACRLHQEHSVPVSVDSSPPAPRPASDEWMRPLSDSRWHVFAGHRTCPRAPPVCS